MIKLPCLLLSAVLTLDYLSPCAKAGSNKHVADIVIDGSTGVKPLVESLVAGYLDQSKYSPTKNKVAETGITVGPGLKPQHRIQALLDKQIDIAMASHGINRKQISEMGLQVHRIAKMAVVIGVNSIDSVTKVPVENLSYQQLCDIYDRKLINWRELTNESNGPYVPIVPTIRPLNEVDPEVLLEHVDCFAQLPLQKLMQNKQLIIKRKSGQMAKFLAQTPGAIGMTTLVRVAQSKGRIKAVALNNIAPTIENLISGTYKFTRNSYLITSAELSPEVQALLTFIKSTEGEDIIIANNAVPAD